MMPNYPDFVPNVFLCQKVKYCVYFLDLSVKNLNGWSDKLETWHVETLDPV